MLDIVAADQHQAPAAVDRHGVDDGEPRQAPATAGDEGAAGIPADQPDDDGDEQENDDQRYDELGDDRSGLAEDRFQHLTHRVAPSSH